MSEKSYNDLAVLMLATDFWIELSEGVKNGSLLTSEVVVEMDNFMKAVAVAVLAGTVVATMVGDADKLDEALEVAEDRLADTNARIQEALKK